jgi:hypothetical protein
MMKQERRFDVGAYASLESCQTPFLAASVSPSEGSGGRAFSAPAPSWFRAVVVIAALAMIPTIGFWSTFTMLRCPACNGLTLVFFVGLAVLQKH